MGFKKSGLSHNNIYIIIIFFILMGIVATLFPYYSIKLMNGLRGYLTGESKWSKAQNAAVHELIRYGIFEDESYLKNFKENVEIIEGYRSARVTLLTGEPDYQMAYNGFKKGQINPGFIDDMIWLLDNYHDFSGLADAISNWEQGDTYIAKLSGVANDIRTDIESGNLDEQQWHKYLDQIYELDAALIHVEERFATNIESTVNTARSFIFAFTTLTGVLLILSAGTIITLIFRKMNNLTAKLSATKEKFSYVLDNSRDIIYQMNSDNTKFEYVSPVAEEMLGYTVDELMEKGPQFILEKVHPDDFERVNNARKQVQQQMTNNDIELDTEYRLQTRSGEYVWVNNKRSAVKDEYGNYVAVVGNVRNITERKKYMEKLDKSLREKDTLLAEIHHRVKNNLAIISSLIELHKKDHTEEIQATLKDLQARIKTIALVHEKLYQTDSFGGVELSDYINELVDLVSDTLTPDDKRITIKRDFEKIKFDLTNAVSFGLICNELISNAYKHAFTNRNEGKIHLVLNKDGKQGIFSVMDNGTGLPEDFSIKKGGSLGMILVDNLAKQLNGELSVHANGWTEFRVTFQVE